MTIRAQEHRTKESLTVSEVTEELGIWSVGRLCDKVAGSNEVSIWYMGGTEDSGLNKVLVSIGCNGRL